MTQTIRTYHERLYDELVRHLHLIHRNNRGVCVIDRSRQLIDVHSVFVNRNENVLLPECVAASIATYEKIRVSSQRGR